MTLDRVNAAIKRSDINTGYWKTYRFSGKLAGDVVAETLIELAKRGKKPFCRDVREEIIQWKGMNDREEFYAKINDKFCKVS